MEVLTAGAIEYLIVDITDRLQGMLNLPATQFEVRNEDGTVRQAAIAAVVVGMNARCLITTTGWPKDEYHLFLWFTTAPEVPKLGPMKFLVN